MFAVFDKYLQERGVTAYAVSKATGIPNSTFSDWKSGRSAPKVDKLIKIANYFEVPLEEFIEGGE